MGVYDDRQRNRFMLRIRIPGGQINADQLDTVAGVIRDFGNGWQDHVEPDRFGEITTRQDIQVHWVEFTQLPEIWRRFDAVGMTSAQACGDSMRNPTACPADGADPRGYLPVATADRGVPHVLEGRGEADRVPAAQVEGRRDRLPDRLRGREAPLPRVHAGARPPTARSGSTSTPGGGLSDSPRIADALDLFVRPDQVTDTVRATLQVYREFGDFDMKAVNRFRVLVHQLGPDKVTDEIRARVGSETIGAGESLWTGEPEDHLGVHPDTSGTHFVGLCIPMGRLTDDEWFEVARLARTHGDGGVRMSQRQNLLLTGIHDVDALLAEDFVQTYTPEPDPFERAIVACTSAPFCKFAIDDMKTSGRKLVAHLQETLPVAGRDRLDGLKLHMSGCKASCAQVQAAHIGVRATMTKDEEAYQQALDISLGGDLGALAAGRSGSGSRSPSTKRSTRSPRSSARCARASSLWMTSPRPASAATSKGTDMVETADRVGSFATAAYRSGAGRSRRHHGCERRAGAPGQDLVPQDGVGRDRRRPVRRLRRVHRRMPVEVDRRRDRDGLPTLVRMCTGCSACWDYCPMAGFRPEKLNHQDAENPVGEVQQAVSARALERPDGAQDGGAVTALLATLMERGVIDAVIQTQKLDAFIGTPGARDDGRAGADRGRQRLPPVRDARDAERALPRGRRADRPGRHAVPDQRPPRDPEVPVGAPRHARDQGDARDRAVLHPVVRPEEADPDGGGRGREPREGRRRSTSARASSSPRRAEGEELMKKPVKDFHQASLKGCDECADFAALGADLVVGNIGSEPGTSTVLLRTDAGHGRLGAGGGRLRGRARSRTCRP